MLLYFGADRPDSWTSAKVEPDISFDEPNSHLYNGIHAALATCNIDDYAMSFFKSDRQLYEVLQAVFDRVREEPQHIEAFTRSNLVIRMHFAKPDAQVLLDGRQPPLEVFYGERPGRADLELTMEADDLHAIWMGRKRLRDSFFNGDIQTRGNVFRASKLTDLFREAERAYPSVIAELGSGVRE